MDLQSIFNIIIACVPTVTTILWTGITAYRNIKEYRRTQKDIDGRSTNTEKLCATLMRQNAELTDMIHKNTEDINKLTKQVYKVINKVEVLDNDQQGNETR